MKKKIANLLVVILLPVMLLAACSSNNEEKAKTGEDNKSSFGEKNDVVEEQVYTLICPDGLPAIATSKFINDAGNVEGVTLNAAIQESTDLLLSEFMKGEADFAIVPSNLALQALKKELDYKVVGTIGWGSLYLVTTGDETEISQLAGKEIYNTGKGLTPDIVFKEILNNNGLTEDDVTLSYVGAASELAPMVLSGQVQYAVLPEPILSTVSSKNENVKVICSLNDQWSKIKDTKNGYPQSTLLIKGETYNKIKDTSAYTELIDLFEDSENWVNDNPELVAAECEKVGITSNAEVLPAAIKNSNLRFTRIAECTDDYNTYFKLIDQASTNEQGEYDSLFIEK